MGIVHRLKQWKQIVLKPFVTALENIAFIILRNNKNFFILNLRLQTNVTSYFTLYNSYKNYEEYLAVQQKKTKRRLEIFFQKSNSIMWTNPDQIGHISRIIKDYFKHQHISGICMGTRSGEEQVLFHKFLGNNSKVLGVELTPDAAVNPHTIIADYHYLPKELFGKFDFVYSNSHDQAYNPRLAITEWLKCLKSDSSQKEGGGPINPGGFTSAWKNGGGSSGSIWSRN